MEPMTWMLIFIILLIIEILTLGLTTIWLAGGALVALVCSALGGSLWLQIGLFMLVSGLLLIFTRPIALKYFNKSRIRTNAEDLIGRHGVVTERIDNLHSTGRAKINGQEWSARAAKETEVIEAGTEVEILEIRGVKLICKRV